MTASDLKSIRAGLGLTGAANISRKELVPFCDLICDWTLLGCCTTYWSSATGKAPTSTETKMKLSSKEHYDLMIFFEANKKSSGRINREDKSMWAKGFIYQHGDVNAEFIAFRLGVAYGKATERT